LLERVARLVRTVPGVTTSMAQCAHQLREGEPRIEVLTNNNPSQVLARVSNDPNVPATRPSSWGHADPHLQIISVSLQPGEDLIVGNQGIVTPDLDLQLRQSMRNLLDDLQEADLDFSDVVSSTVYLREVKDADQVHALYGKFFKGHFPARTTLQNSSFDKKTATDEQISMIAVRQPKH
jgi:enamine deaminase RidA (YjgF/YER057c/UK114 family)